MTAPYCAGAVWWGMLDFGEGERKKYFVLLNDCLQPGDHFFAAITTSQGAKRYRGETTAACGCPAAPCYRIEAGQEPCFSVTTWVQFDNAAPVTRERLDSMGRAGKSGFHGMLDPNRIRSVLNCALKSKDLPGRDADLIRRTLKAMSAPAKKPTAAPSAPKQPSPFAALQMRFERHCAGCKVEFWRIVEGFSKDDLPNIFEGTKGAPEGFVSTVEAGLDLAVEVRRCTCK